MFEKELSSHLGPTPEALNSQYNALRRERYSVTGSWNTLKDAIEAKAAELFIPLNRKKPDGLDPEVEIESDSTLLGDNEEVEQTPSPLHRLSGHPRIGKAIPKIAFRA